MIVRQLDAPLRGAGHDAGEPDTGGGRKQRRMEEPPTEAVSGESDARRGGHLADPATLLLRSRSSRAGESCAWTRPTVASRSCSGITSNAGHGHCAFAGKVVER